MTIRYVIVEEPTEAEPIKYPRMIGRTNDPAASASNCANGEVLIVATGRPTLGYWQNPLFSWFTGIPGDVFRTESTELHLRKWHVEYNGGNYQIVATLPPFISRTYARCQVTAALTIL